MEDTKIIELFWARDDAAISRTQEKYGAYLLKIAGNILHDTEDCRESVNDAYLAAWNSIPPHRPQALGTYLAKLTRRICIDLLRKSTAQKRGSGAYEASLQELAECTGGSSAEEAMDGKLLKQAIEAYLRTLPRANRSLFIRRYFYFDSLKEAAVHCGMTEAKAKTVLFRTRQGLREHLQKEGFMP